ncbi:ALS2 C-terminal-like protein isoform X3 [Trachypithecus francoisi]|uniref:ALS2 C-terminal-like protein isoform X3 n=1 Tax=Trachypithecus francoisi TaxID=54180 RepID=UPI00141B10F4|nr:ALS2 C-terminal-like protein isoform X3 [Trachypithecus francoisi]
MCNPEEAALLRLEEVFSATLARVNSYVLQPLLPAAPEPSDPWGRECLRLLQQLHKSSQQLWEVTEESLHSLQERLRHPDSTSLESLLLLRGADRVLQAHIEYIESYTSCMVVQAFQKAAKRRSEYWRGQRKALRQLLSGVSSEGSVGASPGQALHQPLTHHVQQYVLLLLSLGDTIGEHHPTQELVVNAVTLFGNLQSFMKQALDQAAATQALWHTLRGRPRDVLCTPAHRLLQDSQDVPVTVAPLRAERVLLFDDALVLLQGHNVHTFDLKLVWVDPGQDGCTFHLLTPEEEFSFCAKDSQGQAVWQWKVTQAVRQVLRGKKDFPVLGAGLEPSQPPACRCAEYTFRAEGRLCQATYEGEWCRARPHGKGTLKWPDGRNHVGNFCQGLEHGFGIRLLPQASEDRFDCYKCHWREGSMCGYGICTAPMRCTKATSRKACGTDLGSLRVVHRPPSPSGTQATGRGARGAAMASRRMVTEASATSACGRLVSATARGSWSPRQVSATRAPSRRTRRWARSPSPMASPWRARLAVGQGEDCTHRVCWTQLPSHQTRAAPARGFHMLLSLFWSQGRLSLSLSLLLFLLELWRQLGVGAFPVESRWQGVYRPFQDFVCAGCPRDLQEALLGFDVQSSRELRRSQDYLCCERTHPEDSVGSMEDILEELLQHREPKALQLYLRKALSNSLHPLGKLLRTLMLTFQATYAGVGANKHLQELAQEEVKQHARELWAAYRGLLRAALQRKGQALEEDEDTETRDLQVHGLVLPLMLPSFYSELFTLYLLLHEREDSFYSQGIANLSLFPDTQLLEFLDVQKHLWPLKDLTLTSNQRYSLVRDKCFLSAIECLQKIMTTVDPREKLEVLERTYGEIEGTVSRVLGREYKLPMDDLLPLLIYVVSRARIQHLGAEIHLIRDMMDPNHTGGLYDFLLTALESCHEHIQKEDMRLHRLPGRWHSRELW